MTYLPDANTFGLYNCEGLGLPLVDASSFGNDGTVAGSGIVRQAQGAFGFGVQTVGAGDFLDLSAAAGDWDNDTGLLELYFKPNAANFWNDGVQRVLFDARVNASNRWTIVKNSIDNVFIQHVRGGTTFSVTAGPFDSTQQQRMLGMSWSEGDDEFRAWVDGIQEGATIGGLTAFVGSLSEILVGAQPGPTFEAFGIYDRIRFRNDVVDRPNLFDILSRDRTAGVFNVAASVIGGRDFQTDLKQEVLGL